MGRQSQKTRNPSRGPKKPAVMMKQHIAVPPSWGCRRVARSGPATRSRGEESLQITEDEKPQPWAEETSRHDEATHCGPSFLGLSKSREVRAGHTLTRGGIPPDHRRRETPAVGRRNQPS